MNFNQKQYLACFFICALLFTTGLLVALSVTLPDFLLPKEGITADRSIVSRLRTGTTFKIILLNNSKVFLVMTMGILTCGILSLVQSFVMGTLVGGVVRISLDAGVSSALITAALLPHGVLELSALMVVSALGLYFGLRVYRYTQGLAIDWLNEVKLYGIISSGAYLVLFLAAVIETYLTPSIAGNFL